MKLPTILVLTAACGPHHDFVAGSRNAGTLTTVVDALNAAAGCTWVQTVAGGVDVIDSDAMLRQEGQGILGYWDPVNAEIVLPEPTGSNEGGRQLILIHEIGHAFGLGHELQGIMAPGFHRMRIQEAAADLVGRARQHHVFRCLQ